MTAAATYAAHGWQPIALRPNDKRPLLPGWQTAPLPDTLTAMVANRGANLGVAVPPGFLVLDIDTKGEANGFSTLAQWPPLPDTLTAATPSGGRHCWFKSPPDVIVANRVAVAPGLDIRSAGGYVVAPPSVIDGKSYTWQGWDMVLVLQDLSPADFKAATGQQLSDGETGLILARPKLSYCPPQPPIYIKRKGFAFGHVAPLPSSRGAKLDAAADQLWQLLADEMQADRRHSKNTIEQVAAETMKRAEIRGALARLEASGRVELRAAPGTIQRGQRVYLHPVASPSTFGEANPKGAEIAPFGSPSENPFLASPPYREFTWRRSEPPKVIPLFPRFAKSGRRSDGEARRGEPI